MAVVSDGKLKVGGIRVLGRCRYNHIRRDDAKEIRSDVVKVIRSDARRSVSEIQPRQRPTFTGMDPHGAALSVILRTPPVAPGR